MSYSQIKKFVEIWTINNGLKMKFPKLLLVCKTLHILRKELKNFKSNQTILIKDGSKTYDKMTKQLCVFKVNFSSNRNQGKLESAQEGLVRKVGLEKVI